jgi:hypothetical protein
MNMTLLLHPRQSFERKSRSFHNVHNQWKLVLFLFNSQFFFQRFLPLRVDFVSRLEKQPFSRRANGTVDALNKHAFWVFGEKLFGAGACVGGHRATKNEKHISPYVRAAACALLSRGGAHPSFVLCVLRARVCQNHAFLPPTITTFLTLTTGA